MNKSHMTFQKHTAFVFWWS